MRSRFVLSSDQGFLASKQSGLLSRTAGALVFCLVGAVAATQFYPQMFADRHAELLSATDAGRTLAATTNADATLDRGSRAAAFSPRDEAQYTAGPIPGFTSLPTSIEPAAAKEGTIASDEDKSAAPKAAEKPHRTKYRSTREYSYNRHSNTKAQERRYRQPPSTWVAGNSWNSWGGNSWGGNSWGGNTWAGRNTQFARQYDFWR